MDSNDVMQFRAVRRDIQSAYNAIYNRIYSMTQYAVYDAARDVDVLQEDFSFIDDDIWCITDNALEEIMHELK